MFLSVHGHRIFSGKIFKTLRDEEVLNQMTRSMDGAMEKTNAVRINKALRCPLSVEISMESVGETRVLSGQWRKQITPRSSNENAE